MKTLYIKDIYKNEICKVLHVEDLDNGQVLVKEDNLYYVVSDGIIETKEDYIIQINRRRDANVAHIQDYLEIRGLTKEFILDNIDLIFPLSSKNETNH